MTDTNSKAQVTDAFQDRVQPWMMACFGPEISADKLERNDRFIEEALELVQASDYPKARALALVDYVYGRDQGEINQEVGGVMVTLAAHCLAHGVDMHEAAETELARIWTKVETIRAKQAAKPTGSALPIAALAAQEKPEPGVEVKKLEWDGFTTSSQRHFQSNTILGQFQIGYLGEFECWQLYSPQKAASWKDCFSRHTSSDEAKAAAQSDYETRILSALVHVPAVEPGLSVWSGWDQSNPPWSQAKHQDAVCAAVFGPTWAMEDAAALIGYINSKWPVAPPRSPLDGSTPVTKGHANG
jgi:NTP pyrophosphatase (non-canonical NTP hydrolase)